MTQKPAGILTDKEGAPGLALEPDSLSLARGSIRWARERFRGLWWCVALPQLWVSSSEVISPGRLVAACLPTPTSAGVQEPAVAAGTTDALGWAAPPPARPVCRISEVPSCLKNGWRSVTLILRGTKALSLGSEADQSQKRDGKPACSLSSFSLSVGLGAS